MIRDILNYQGNKIGELELPDNTPEDVWDKKLASFAVAPPSQEEVQASYLEYSIIERKQFAEKMLENFKARNISQGINAVQGMWMHHTLRAYPVTFAGMNFTIDIMNLAISGDLEIACLCLMYGYTDSGEESYHWLTSERKNYIISELKAFLGWS